MFLSRLKNKKEVISWSLYDFANQPFTTIIVTFVYGAFFTSVIASDENTGTFLWTLGISITAIIVAILGLSMLYYGVLLHKKQTNIEARKLMLSSVLYITAIQIIYVIDKLLH